MSEKNQIPHSRPFLGQEEIDAVSHVIKTGFIAQGEVVRQFEKAFARKIGVKYAVSTSSGTAALHLVLMAMNISAGDEVIIPAYVCCALLNAVQYVGATPVFADIQLETGNIDPDDIKKRLTPQTKAIIVPHMFGLPAQIEDICALGVPVIEDCAQSIGACRYGKTVGTFGAAAIFSFYATKVITTGEGGMVISNDESLIEQIRDLREYDQKDRYRLRFNYKMTNIQAAMGLVQIERIESFIQRRRAIAGKYNEFLSPLKFRLPKQDSGHIYYRYVIGLDTDIETLIKTLVENNIYCAKPVHMPLYHYWKNPQNQVSDFPNTESAWISSVSIPIYPALSDNDVERLIKDLIDLRFTI